MPVVGVEHAQTVLTCAFAGKYAVKCIVDTSNMFGTWNVSNTG